MFCRNCAAQLPPGACVCPHCGVPAGLGSRYCPQCGAPVSGLAVMCPRCGCALKAAAPVQKSRIVAGLLAIFLGALGIHNFYLGHNDRAILQLLLSTVGALFTCGLSAAAVSIWALVEGIQLLTGSVTVDAKGIWLKD